MAKAFETTKGDLIDKLPAALEAGDLAGGDRRGKQSAAILVMKEGGEHEGYAGGYIDLRADNHRAVDMVKVFKLFELLYIWR